MKHLSFFLCSLIIAGGIVASPKAASADAFEVHLFYDPAAKTLNFDKKKPKPVTLNEEKALSVIQFLQESEKMTGNYTIGLYEANGGELVKTKFTPANNAFIVEMPYFSLATDVKILDANTNQELLKASVKEFSTCNANGVCEYELRETFNRCLGDCGSSKITYSQDTQNLLKQNKGVIKDPKTGEVVLKDERFADPTFTPPSSTTPPSTTGPSGSSPSGPSAPAVEPEREISTWKIVLLGIFVFVSATAMVYYLKKKMKQ